MIPTTRLKLGSHRGKLRLWIEAKTKLLPAGFEPDTRFALVVKEGEILLDINGEGSRKVSRAFRKGVARPIVDINSPELAESGFAAGEPLVASYHDGYIKIRRAS